MPARTACAMPCRRRRDASESIRLHSVHTMYPGCQRPVEENSEFMSSHATWLHGTPGDFDPNEINSQVTVLLIQYMCYS